MPASGLQRRISLLTTTGLLLILFFFGLASLRGMEATQEIHQRVPEVRVLALTMHDREEYFFAMLEAGASGYVLKEGAPEELLTSIRAVHRGEAFLSPARGTAATRSKKPDSYTAAAGNVAMP